MGMSTQRFFLILLGLNLVIGLVVTISTPANYSTLENPNRQITSLEEQELLLKTDESLGTPSKPFSVNQVAETTPGNTIFMGKGIVMTILNTMNPWSISPDMYDNEMEKNIAGAIGWFRTVMVFLLMYEIYLIWKNKKAS